MTWFFKISKIIYCSKVLKELNQIKLNKLSKTIIMSVFLKKKDLKAKMVATNLKQMPKPKSKRESSSTLLDHQITGTSLKTELKNSRSSMFLGIMPSPLSAIKMAELRVFLIT